jgi:hypothetical protein
VTRPRRRFIAGAVCPRCGAQDRIVVFLEAEGAGGEGLARECVACGFEDRMADGPGPGEAPRGRLDAPRPRPAGERAQPIRFYPRPPKRGGD